MEKNEKTAGNRRDTLVQVLSTLAAGIVAVALALLFSAVLIPQGSFICFVDGDSMLPTLTDGQMLYTDTTPLQHGDIVISRMPQAGGSDTLIVKRIIALPGDTLTINAEGVFVNGELQEESYLTEEAAAATYLESRYNYLILGPDEYFLLGDNRACSLDSRYFGPVAEENLQYKQSVTPTKNTYSKLILLAIMLVACVCLFSLLDFVITKLLKKLLPAEQAATEEPEADEIKS